MKQTLKHKIMEEEIKKLQAMLLIAELLNVSQTYKQNLIDEIVIMIKDLIEI